MRTPADRGQNHSTTRSHACSDSGSGLVPRWDGLLLGRRIACGAASACSVPRPPGGLALALALELIHLGQFSPPPVSACIFWRNEYVPTGSSVSLPLSLS